MKIIKKFCFSQTKDCFSERVKKEIGKLIFESLVFEFFVGTAKLSQQSFQLWELKFVLKTLLTFSYTELYVDLFLLCVGV